MDTNQQETELESKEKFFLNYKPAGPVAGAFHLDNSFFRGLMGPVGSGKSVACCLEMFIKSKQRPIGKSGLRKSRWLVVRNTGPELETTTIKTWLDWFPEKIFGKMNRKPPITHMVRIADIEMEVIFLALDRDEDAKKLKSLEATGIWFNEAKYIQKSILDESTTRVRRYPSKKDKPDDMPDTEWLPWSGIIADTNPHDDSHWWYKFAEEETPKGYKFFRQPSGLSKDAENIQNHNSARYYDDMIPGKTKEFVDVLVHGNYGYIANGQPVYGKEWNENLHVSNEPIKIIPKTTIYAGIDFGLTPAIVFGQRTAQGQWQIFKEIVTEKNTTMPLPQFASIIKQYINTFVNDHNIIIYGDPSGGFRDQQGMTAFDIFKAKDVRILPAPTNNLLPRREAVLSPLGRLINGMPGILLDKNCRLLRKGFNGQYKYRRLQVGGDTRHSPEPEKNEYSHPHDALQYLLCGGGEYRDLRKTKNENLKNFKYKKWQVM